MIRYGDLLTKDNKAVYIPKSNAKVEKAWEQIPFSDTPLNVKECLQIAAGLIPYKHTGNWYLYKEQTPFLSDVPVEKYREIFVRENIHWQGASIEQLLKWNRLDDFYRNLDWYENDINFLVDDIEWALWYDWAYNNSTGETTIDMKPFREGRFSSKGKDEWEMLRTADLDDKVILPFNREDYDRDFCVFTMHTVFTKNARKAVRDQDSYKLFYKPWYVDNKRPIRTFRSVMRYLTPDADLVPYSEDLWLIEKSTGISTVLALFPTIAEDNYSQLGMAKEIKRIVETMMKCKPIHLRIHLSNLVSKAICECRDDFLLNDNRSDDTYDDGKFEELISHVAGAIDHINGNYLALLNLIHVGVKNGSISNKDLVIEFDKDNFERYNQREGEYKNRAAQAIINRPGYIYADSFFEAKDPIVKRTAPSNNVMALYSMLQSQAILSSAEMYRPKELEQKQ